MHQAFNKGLGVGSQGNVAIPLLYEFALFDVRIKLLLTSKKKSFQLELILACSSTLDEVTYFAYSRKGALPTSMK